MLSPRWILPVVLTMHAMFSGCASAPPAAPAEAAAPQQTLQVGDTTVLAVSPAAQPCCKQNIFQFLGLDVVGRGLGGLARRGISRVKTALNLTGRFPNLQPKPPILPITDPANLSGAASPSVKVAAEVKAEQDAAPQKIQGLRYLATIGCGGCYTGVEDALLAALDDCTEEVRYEAAVALRSSPNPCAFCRSDACCSPKVRKKLNEIANETDDDGCNVEPSERVRRQARLALEARGGYVDTSTAPDEGPTAAPVEELSANDVRSPLSSEIQLVAHLSEVVPRQPNDIVLAEVNGRPVYESQLATQVERDMKLLSHRKQGQDLSDLRRALTRKYLHQRIDRELVAQAALAGIKRPNEGRDQVPSTERVAKWLEEQLQHEDDISATEIRAYYERHSDRYRMPGKLRWEQVTADINRFPTREHARRTMAYVRSRVLRSDLEPPRDVAPHLVETRICDLNGVQTAPPRFVTDVLSRLPVGRMSTVLEYDGGFHVLRVVERRAPKVVSLVAAEAAIRREILADHRRQREQRFVEKLRREADLWTVFQGRRPTVARTTAPPSLERVPPNRPASKDRRPADMSDGDSSDKPPTGWTEPALDVIQPSERNPSIVVPASHEILFSHNLPSQRSAR